MPEQEEVPGAPHAKVCSHKVNTNSQIGTIQDSYPALSYPVKSHLATLPAPVTRPNSFPFCTRIPSTSLRGFRFSLFDFRVSLFEFRFSPFDFRVSSVTPLSTAFTPNLLLSPLSTVFTQINRGVPLEEAKNERHSTQHHEPATTASPRCQHRSLKGRCQRAAKQTRKTLRAPQPYLPLK
jgi:hypothetical protein